MYEEREGRRESETERNKERLVYEKRERIKERRIR
jgi:hypothetical protein